MSKKISYATRDFAGLRNELVTLTKDYYPELIKNFNDASVYSVLLESETDDVDAAIDPVCINCPGVPCGN